MKRTLILSLLALLAASLPSCVPLAVGATAGYVAHDQGYRVQSPIKKTEPDESYDEVPQEY